MFIVSWMASELQICAELDSSNENRTTSMVRRQTALFG